MFKLRHRTLAANSRAATTLLPTRLTPATARRFFLGSPFDPPRAGMTIRALMVPHSTEKRRDTDFQMYVIVGAACRQLRRKRVAAITVQVACPPMPCRFEARNDFSGFTLRPDFASRARASHTWNVWWRTVTPLLLSGADYASE